MNQTHFQPIINYVNSAKKEIENLPKSGMNKKALEELNLAINALNDSIGHCDTAMRNM